MQFDRDNFNPEIFATVFLVIQREIFLEICRNFSENVREKNLDVYNRSLEFSKDFNNFDFNLSEDFDISERNYPNFCNFVFDFMNYIRKIDEKLYKSSIKFAENQLNFPNLPTLDKSVKNCSRGFYDFLEWRENNFDIFEKHMREEQENEEEEEE